jgi:hypothetical protein
MVPSVIDIQLGTLSATKQKATFDFYKGEIKDGTVLCIFELPQPNPFAQTNLNSKVGLEIAIKHSPPEGMQHWTQAELPTAD